MKGSIEELIKDKKYRVRVDIGYDTVTSKRKQKTMTIKGTRKDAEKALAKLVLDEEKLLAEVISRREPKAHKRTQELTFEEYMEEWYEAITYDLRSDTKVLYRKLIEYIKGTDIAAISLVEVRPPNVQRAVNQLPARG